MKKKFIITISVIGQLLCLSSCSNSNQYDYQTRWGLNTPVRSMKISMYEASSKFGEPVKGDLLGIAKVTLNEVGNTESVKGYDDDGDLEGIEKYKYNEKNLLTEQISYNPDGDAEYKVTHEYEGDHISTLIITYYHFDTPDEVTYHYKHNGEKIDEVTITRNGELTGTSKYTLFSKTRREWTNFDKDGAETGHCYQEFDSYGNIIKMCMEDGVVREVEWKGNLPIKLINARLMLGSVSWSSFDDENITFVEYEFDDHGNWITQTIFKGEERNPVNIFERTINY